MSKYFWIGEGVIPYKGKDIAYGEALPEDFPKESITSMLAKKKLSTQPPATQSGAAVVNAEVKRLQDRLAEVTEGAERNCKEILRLQELLTTKQNDLARAEELLTTRESELRQAQEQISTLNATVEGLTAAQFATTGDSTTAQVAGPAASQAAGPKDKK